MRVPEEDDLTRIAYVNGEFLPLEHAKISVLDRGFLFADGIYEVTSVLGGRLVDHEAHLARLERSLREVSIQMPLPLEKLVALQEELVRRNALDEGVLYFQVTRGIADRDFACPKDTAPSLVMFTQAKRITASPAAEAGIAVISVPDLRWQRRDIKSVALLPQVLAKSEAVAAGAEEAWMVENGYVTEGASSSAFIITKAGAIVTRPLSNEILAGCTRKAIMRLAEERSLDVEQRRFTLHDAYDAAEAFITSASNFVMPVVRIDGRVIGGGVPGPMTRRLRELYVAFARGETIAA